MPHGHANILDTINIAAEPELFDNALWLLQSLGLDPAIVPAPTSERGWDGNLQLHWQGKPLSYRLLIKRGLRPSDIGSVARAIQAAGNNVFSSRRTRLPRHSQTGFAAFTSLS